MASIVLPGDLKRRQRLPDDVLGKIMELKPYSNYTVGCAIYVEEKCLKKVCPGEYKRLKVSVLFKFNSNIDPEWVKTFRTRPRRRINTDDYFSYRARKIVKYNGYVDNFEDRHLHMEVTLHYMGLTDRGSRALSDPAIYNELVELLTDILTKVSPIWFEPSRYVLEKPLDRLYWGTALRNMKYEKDNNRYKLFTYFRLQERGKVAISKRFTTQKLKRKCLNF